MMEKNHQTKKWLVRGIIVGAVAGAAIAASNKNVRVKVTDSVECFRNKTKHYVTLLNENRGPLVEKIRQSGDRITSVVEKASSDFENIVESTLHMKDHAKNLVHELEETKKEFQSFASHLNEQGTDQLENERDLLPKAKEE